MSINWPWTRTNQTMGKWLLVESITWSFYALIWLKISIEQAEAGLMKNPPLTLIDAGFVHEKDASLIEIEAGFMQEHV